jgi:hypothetical protein
MPYLISVPTAKKRRFRPGRQEFTNIILAWHGNDTAHVCSLTTEGRYRTELWTGSVKAGDGIHVAKLCITLHYSGLAECLDTEAVRISLGACIRASVVSHAFILCTLLTQSGTSVLFYIYFEIYGFWRLELDQCYTQRAACLSPFDGPNHGQSLDFVRGGYLPKRVIGSSAGGARIEAPNDDWTGSWGSSPPSL